ncbi:Uncharacterised protein [Providencia rettgeri]|uniref:Uncharacterized protein n=3 Tax=Gammaproteobacteria TaxID=1236 RepID=A0A2X2FML8_PRORE|nr:Uncharacterised protein [Providencia rettgeri]SUC29640.1 Uncharacterised protein [Providencia rettgeri]
MISLREGGAQDMRSRAPSVKTKCGVMNAMNSLNQLQPRKQFKCLLTSKSDSIQYVEIITLADESGNYQTKQQLVDKDSSEFKRCWAEYYFRSGRGGHVQ